MADQCPCLYCNRIFLFLQTYDRRRSPFLFFMKIINVKLCLLKKLTALPRVKNNRKYVKIQAEKSTALQGPSNFSVSRYLCGHYVTHSSPMSFYVMYVEHKRFCKKRTTLTLLLYFCE